ncbi:MAG: acyl-CoA dehydrogenase, middle domain protein, partial [Alphaproteobacteria bacterium]|nr:acyl-CoA dehydrogenase, middle domain protein [Alphaproteobacteria bacterium]
LPTVLNTLVGEFLASSNLSFSLYPGLTQGAIHALIHHGSDALKQKFLPKMVAGTWTGTMNLTEPHAGTDLGLLRTKAMPNGDDTFNITGTKIYISCGEHDCSENIIHLVLARLPDAPAGVKGISLFIVPKLWVNEDGSLGEKNNLGCGSIEHKMGLHGSPTCVMNYDNARGYLVGDAHKGLRAMFTMMNEARLWVGIQGFAVAEVAYQNARNYAFDRLQARGLNGPVHPEKAADPIIVHPEVRKNLLTMKAFLDGFRAFAIDVAINVDLAEHHPDAEVKQQADDFVALMIPIIKAYGTDMGSEIANLGMQVHGGAGYCRDYGAEQFTRDVRITQIYEGTNGIQALDLIGRKMGQNYGRLLRRFFHPTLKMLDEMQNDPLLVEHVFALRKAVGKLQQATVLVGQSAIKDKNEAGAASTDYLRIFSLVVLGSYWLKIMRTANEKLTIDPGQKEFYAAKIHTGKFFFDRMLPEVQGRFAMLSSGAKPLMNMSEEEFKVA